MRQGVWKGNNCIYKMWETVDEKDSAEALRAISNTIRISSLLKHLQVHFSLFSFLFFPFLSFSFLFFCFLLFTFVYFSLLFFFFLFFSFFFLSFLFFSFLFFSFLFFSFLFFSFLFFSFLLLGLAEARSNKLPWVQVNTLCRAAREASSKCKSSGLHIQTQLQL